MEARIINDQRQWNEFIEGAEQCNVTQSYEWGQLLTTLDGEVLYVGVVDDAGKMCAAMLLLVSRVSVANSVYFYAPRGPIIDDPESPIMAVLLNYVKALAHKYHAFMLKVEPGASDNDARWLAALHRRGFVANPEALHLRHEWVLDIRPDEQTLLAGMKKTWRYCVRLASRKDVTVRRGESIADINTFYTILQTTSQRDTFMIYSKEFYEKLLELYGKSQNVALFIAEYEGQALGAALLVKMGRWCWYMYGASSNEHRDRMPNHLLQWTAIRWAKEQGCWYYNFRGIPDVLEESQPMWGVYLFKSGFGGYAMRSLETHDLVYNPLLYRLYRGWLDGRSWLKDVRARRQSKQNEATKPEKQEKQNDGEQPKDVQQTTQPEVEKPAKRSGVQPGSKPAAQKQPEQPQPSRGEPWEAVPQVPENSGEARQDFPANGVEVPVVQLEPAQAVVEPESEASISDENLQKDAVSLVEVLITESELAQAVVVTESEADISQVPQREQLEGQESQAQIGHEDQSIYIESQMQPAQSEELIQPILEPAGERMQREEVEVRGEPLQIEEDDREAQAELEETRSAQVEGQNQPILEQLDGEKQPELVEGEAEFQQQVGQTEKEKVEVLQVEGESGEVQPELMSARVEEQIQLEHTEVQEEQMETIEAKDQESVEHAKTKAEEVVEELEMRANARKQAEAELERQTRAWKQTEEESEDQASGDEETQKLPKVKMAQKYSGARRPMGPNGSQ